MAKIDITTLKNQVRASLSGNVFSLALPSLGSPSLTALANAALPGALLHLTGARLEEPVDGKSIIVHGKGVDLPFTGLECEARFAVFNEMASLQLSARGDKGWHLSTGFPLFEQSVLHDLSFTDSPPPTLYLYSDPGEDKRPAGLTFAGSLDLNAITGGLAGLIGRSTQPVTGSFALQQQGSELDSFSMSGEVASGIDLVVAKNVELSFGVGAWLGTSPYDGESYFLPYLELGTTVPFSAQGESHPLPVTLTIFDLKGDFRFETDLTGLVDAAVDEIKALTQKIGLDGLLPKNFDLQNYLSLSHFFFDFNPVSSPHLTQIGVDVLNAHPWTIVHLADSNKDWALDKVMLSLRVTNPGEQDSNKSLLASGELKVGAAGVLLISARYPTWEFDLSLKEGTTLNLTEVLEEFMGHAAGAPQIELDTFTLHVAQNDYSLAVTVRDDWTLEKGLLAIEEVSLSIHHTTASTQATVSGTFTIANVALMITADHPADPKAGWKFQGQTLPGSRLAIGDLLYDLAATFGIENVPQPIKSLSLSNIALMYDTGNGIFSFTCEGDFHVADTPVTLKVMIDVKPTQSGDDQQAGTIQGTKGYNATFRGEVMFEQSTFTIVFNTRNTSENAFIASYHHTGQQKAIALRDLIAPISANLANEIPSDIAIDLQSVKFVFLQQNQSKQFAFGLDLGTTLSLADLPLIGDKLPADLILAVKGLQFTYSSAPFTKEQVALVNPLLPVGIAALPAAGLAQGISAAADLQIGQATQHLVLGVSAQQQQNVPLLLAAGSEVQAGAGGSSAQVKWVDIQRSFGPASFKRIGVQFQGGILRFLLDASLTVGVLSVQLNGLSFGSPVSHFAPSFHLDGMGAGYANPPLLIEGAFLAVPQDQLGNLDFEYNGALTVEAASFSLAAVGSYAQAHGEPSLFLFAEITKELGGPPYFFVTGLMGGFGFNRRLRIPNQDEVYLFPFVRGLTDQAYVGGKGASLLAILDILDGRGNDPSGKPNVPWITPVMGEYWVAVGLQWTSFELVNAHALAVVEFGQDLIVALIGLATMKLPQEGPETFSYLELEIELILNIGEGLFSLTAVLSPNSYVLDQNCKLTGGFALFLWFKGEHTGDFVVTAGGYHPLFLPPAHYPREPRLGFNWPVNDQVKIHGEAYFALTPSMAMGGGLLDMRFQSGDLQAWFTARADFLMQWRPFSFEGEIALSLGASYKLNLFSTSVTLSTELGALLEIWGPRIGGMVHIDWYVISFTVSFGEGKPTQPKTQGWSALAPLLPAPDNIIKITTNSGLVSDTDGLWTVRADEFSFSTQTAIPCNQLFLGQSKTPQTDVSQQWKLDIRPLQRTDLISQHRVRLTQISGEKVVDALAGEQEIDLAAWNPLTPLRSVTEALWGKPVDGQLRAPAANLLSNRLQGYSFAVPGPEQGQIAGPIPLERLSYEELPAGKLPVNPGAQPDARHVPQEDRTSVQIIINTLDVRAQARAAAHDALKAFQTVDLHDDALPDLRAQANTLFRDAPLLVKQ